MKTIEDILNTKDERLVVAKPEQMFRSAYGCIHFAAEMTEKMAEQNIGNVSHGDLLRLAKAVREANCAVIGLEVWRRNNPLKGAM